MKPKFNFFMFLSTISFLSGCDDKKSVDWYMHNHSDMIKKYEECLVSKSIDDQACQNTTKALLHERNNEDVKEAIKKIHRKSDTKNHVTSSKRDCRGEGSP